MKALAGILVVMDIGEEEENDANIIFLSRV